MKLGLKKLLTVLPAVALLMLAALAAVAIPNYSGFTQRNPGYVVLASDWNNEFGNLIAYINNNITAALNLLTAGKGYLLSSDGTNVAQVTNAGSGDNGKFLSLDSTQPAGMKWSNLVGGVAAMTTKGDLLGYNTNLARIPVGTDGQVLTANSGNALGVSWTNGGIPSGCILLWSGTQASIPSGYVLCDGLNGTPNLEGAFIVGAGSTSPALSGGLGNVTPGSTGGANTHLHSIAGNVPLSAGANLASGANYRCALVGTYSTNETCYAAYNVPVYYALCYIMKQ